MHAGRIAVRLMDQDPCGPACRFSDAHIYYTMCILAEGERLGRRALAQRAGVGEGTMRTMLDALRGCGLVDVAQSGIAISPEGRELMDRIGIRLVDVPRSDHVVGGNQMGIVVRGGASRVTDGMAQRDSAVIAGGDGASVFTLVEGMLLMPPSLVMDGLDRAFADGVRRTAGMEEGDALIVAGSSSPRLSAVCAIAAGLEMLRP